MLYEHFRGSCKLEHFSIQPIEKISDDNKSEKTKRRKEREEFWIRELRTLTPYGLNDRLGSKNWRFRSRDDIAGLNFNKLKNRPRWRGKGGGKRNEEKKEDVLFKILTSFYHSLKNWRFLLRCKINSLSVARLREVFWTFSEYRYISSDFPKEIADLALDMINFRLFKQKEKEKVKRSVFLKTFFQNKRVERLGIPSVLREKMKFLPEVLKDEDPPTVIYQRSKTIGSTIFNYKKVVQDFIASDWMGNNINKHTCECKNSVFSDPHHKHVVTMDLRIIEDRKLRKLFCNGPKYREKTNENWPKFLKSFKFALDECVDTWSSKRSLDKRRFVEWKQHVLEEVKSRIRGLSRAYKRTRSVLQSPKSKAYLEGLQNNFVFVPIDKASGNIAIVCKKFYIEQTMKELCISEDSKIEKNGTYTPVDSDIHMTIKKHKDYMKSNFAIEDIPEKLPFLYWIPKMHKKPFSKQRYIAASHDCSTKPLSAILTKALKLVERQHKTMSKRYKTDYGINPMWIIHNSKSVHDCIAPFNRKRDCFNIKTYDFSTLYTSIPHPQLKQQLKWVVEKAFELSGKFFITITSRGANWSDNPRESSLYMNCKQLVDSINWLIDNIYVTFGNKCFRQVIGIPMGTDCAPFLANLFLYSYEFKWIDQQRRDKNFKNLLAFQGCCRYIDDLFLVHNDGLMKKFMTTIYPPELVLVPDDSDGKTTPFLDLLITVEKSRTISTSIFDKRDAFDFPIVNFPVLTGNIPQKSSYGVFVGELVRYARACTFLKDFKGWVDVLVKKLEKQHFTTKNLKRSWKRFCDSHFLLVQKFGRAVLTLQNNW